MPAFVAALWGGFLNIIGGAIAQALISGGIAVVTYTGVDTVLDRFKADAISAFGGLPAEMVGLLSYMKVGVAISIITSAIAVRMGLAGMNGAVKRFKKK